MRSSTLKRLILLTLVSGATLMQTGSCVQVAAETVGGVSSSIVNQYIRSVITDWLGTGSGLPFGLTT